MSDHTHLPNITTEYQQRLLEIKKQHFHMNSSYQVMSSDDITFLISELCRLYFPYQPNVSYTKDCNTLNT